MKRIFGLIFFIAFALVGCGLETKTLPQFYEKDLADVTKIVIVDGSTGYKKTVTENEIIKEFLGEIKDIKFIPEENQEKRVGWRYSITVFQDDEQTFQFGLNEVNENYYYTEPDIHPIVDNFYEHLEVREE
ncbi:hypothetical protein [Paenisporosarcina indica]|uniref:hypothetical protein n=1 Tax=Paenisporosarcina indica TaxID=650093 RepID=UPI00094FBB52|nr:hypothetical protein [Paenisporosarcina indica]